jgi:hypothetical protein
MKTLLAILLLIPSLSWGKDLKGVKLWCEGIKFDPDTGQPHLLFDFLDASNVKTFYISQYGILEENLTYEVDTAYVRTSIGKIIAEVSFRINRKTLKIRDNYICDVKKISNSKEFINEFFHKEFESKNKI